MVINSNVFVFVLFCFLGILFIETDKYIKQSNKRASSKKKLSVLQFINKIKREKKGF